jgi:transcriptional regulator with XRE-family HTH domain
MKYQDTLKEHLSRRMGMNPRYSLRAFAKALGLEPSKLSEVLSGKKGLSADRAELVCERLRLQGLDRDLFVLSVISQHSRVKKQREDAAKKIKELLLSKNSSKERTTQKNAWYFGVIKFIREMGISTDKLQLPLQLTNLQIENSNRYYERIKKNHPERQSLTYEPVSIVKKLNEDFSVNAITHLDAEFLFLSEEQAATLSRIIRKKIVEFSQSNRQENKMNLYMFLSGFSKLCSKEDIC